MPNGSHATPKKSAKQHKKDAKKSAAAGKKHGESHAQTGGVRVNDKLIRKLEEVAAERALEQRSAVDLAKALCCPNAFPAFRVQDGYSSMPTSCEDPYMVHPALFSGTEGAVLDVLGHPANEVFAFASRDPRCTLRYYDPVGGNYSYRAVLNTGTELLNVPEYQTMRVDHWRTDRPFSPHGPKLYMGTYSSGGEASAQRWTLGHDIQSLNVNGLLPTTACDVFVDLLIGDEVETYLYSGTTTAGGALVCLLSNFTAENGGIPPPHTFHWANLRINHPVVDGSLDIIDDGPLLRQIALADWEDVENIFEKLRFNALNLMFSNTAPALSRGGFSTAWQVPSNMDFIALHDRGFEALANKPDAERLVADEGIHIFWKSTSPKDWEYIDVGGPEDTDDTTCYQLYGGSDYLAVALSINNASGRGGYWSIFSDTQARQDSVWFGTGYPDHTRATFQEALELQSRIPQVHCNPFHIKDIFKWVGAHKGQLLKSAHTINELAGGGARGYAAINGAEKFLNIWFK